MESVTVTAGGCPLDVLLSKQRSSGPAVLLLHGFPDSRHLWDLQAHVIGHDWGAALAWFMAMKAPSRVDKLVVLSVGHAGALFGGGGMRQRQRSWYMLWFVSQPPPAIEEQLKANNWALFRELFPVSSGDQEQYIKALGRPGALAEAVKIYHHNVRPESFGTTRFLPFPRLGMEVMGVWSSGDPALTEAQMAESARYVQPGKWRYERIEGAGHWIPRDAPEQLNRLLLDFLGTPHHSAAPARL
ncbi:hypothetical protein N2152v2_010819 [Parachlorella kessleri]